MKEKIYIFIEEAPYRKGVERYLELTKIGGRDIRLIENLGQIKKDEKALLLTDSKSGELSKLNRMKIYHLTDHSKAGSQNICKYNSFEDILSSLINKEEDEEEKRDFKIICLSSIKQGVGKSLIAKEAASILAGNKKTALISIYPSFEEQIFPYRLDELMLSSMNGSKINLEESEYGLYQIAPFKLIEDYIELDIKCFHKLLRELNDLKGIEYFVVEAKHFLDKTSRELIKLAGINLIVIEEDGMNNNEELNYISGLVPKESHFKIIKNKVKRLKREDELPYVYGFDSGNEEVDLRHFSSLLRQILEEL